MRAIAAKEARERDLVLLDYAIKKDRAGEAEEKAKKDEEKRVSEPCQSRPLSTLPRVRMRGGKGFYCTGKA